MSRILLLVELKGGNDGLNTLVPYADAKYRELRPAIGVARERVLPLDERVGLHEKLEPLDGVVEGQANSRSCRASAIPIPTARTSVRSRSGTPPRPRTRP